jgi:hypothetical protein
MTTRPLFLRMVLTRLSFWVQSNCVASVPISLRRLVAA